MITSLTTSITSLTTSIPKHAEAYKIAASHFLSDTAGYEGQELEHLMNLDEDDATPDELERRAKIILWQPLENLDHGMGDPYLAVADLIEGMALDILIFAESHGATN